MKYEKSCGAIIYRKKSALEFLLINSRAYQHWSFPKGHVEANETEEETAKREIQEETGLNVKLHQDFKRKISYNPYKRALKDVVYFLAEPLSDFVSIQMEEISRFVWLPYEDALNYITFENEKDVFKDAYQFILNNEKNT